MCPASAKTAGSTRTRRCGWSWRRRGSEVATKQSSSSTCSIPSTGPGPAPRSNDTRGSRTSWRVMCTRTVSTPDAPAGPGTPARPDGCIAPAWRAFLDCDAVDPSSRSIPAFHRRGPTYTISWRIGATRFEILVTNPERRCRGIAEATLDGAPVNPRAIPIGHDGGTHTLRVVLGDRMVGARDVSRGANLEGSVLRA